MLHALGNAILVLTLIADVSKATGDRYLAMIKLQPMIKTTKRMVFIARQFFQAWATRQLTPFSDDPAF